MSDPLETIVRFLNQFGDVVEGRGPTTPPPPEIRAELEAMASGALNAEQRDDLVRRLRSEPGWVSFLASSMRQRAAGNPDDSQSGDS